MAWGHAWQGGMHGRGACVARNMCGRGMCMAGEVCMAGGCVWQVVRAWQGRQYLYLSSFKIIESINYVNLANSV